MERKEKKGKQKRKKVPQRGSNLLYRHHLGPNPGGGEGGGVIGSQNYLGGGGGGSSTSFK